MTSENDPIHLLNNFTCKSLLLTNHRFPKYGYAVIAFYLRNDLFDELNQP